MRRSLAGLLLTSQRANALRDRVKIVANIVFLANHGVMVGGPSVAVSFDDLYFLERACRQQVYAMSTGRPLKIIPDMECRHTARQWMQVLEL
ncbi:MAG: class II aldolase/adducin family protein [Hyphomicrobiales bacterium]